MACPISCPGCTQCTAKEQGTATGVCNGADCSREYTLTLADVWHNCPYCGRMNKTVGAVYRYSVRTRPTPDPIMQAVDVKAAFDAVGADDPAQAFKSDSGKVMFDLLEDGAPNALLEIAKVMTWAVEVKGYHAHSWQEIPDAIRRYRAALGRHRNAIARGEVRDPESGMLHWAHAACCVIFITELQLRGMQNEASN